MEENQVSKQRHFFVSFWLKFLILSNSIVIVMYLFGSKEFLSYLKQTNAEIIESIIVSFLSIILLIMILKWKKWAFWLYVIISLIKAGRYYQKSDSILILSLGIGMILLLYAILQIRKNDISAWKNLE